MKKMLLIAVIVAGGLLFTACGGKKESAQSIAEKWCDLNSKVHKATDETAKEAAQAARKKYEQEVEEKYKDNKDFMEEVGREVEKCEAASEGK